MSGSADDEEDDAAARAVLSPPDAAVPGVDDYTQRKIRTQYGLSFGLGLGGRSAFFVTVHAAVRRSATFLVPNSSR